ncbi:hypothetical protein CXG81DRAFT_29442 [Caulochytrium protostelioides]|uniref:Nucleoside phosphorylase domain-containing protein n=1 Tax=Caulochytrium protostelioides TaxID=1555241 RepID=A0A4P9XBF5_9FUNG|nr:hypothetical protein CXG81DRAFT_29442 [Caulochytrium protostelioides]|eukprot:RKP02716.1 hypothetical protein CXG81DRAFT_29442 [Caulochytrium protostelioides]
MADHRVPPIVASGEPTSALSPAYANANFPLDPDGRTYHVHTKAGQIAPRVVTVGDMLRARTLATHLDGPPAFEHTSKRGFHAITGTFRGVPVSIVAIGMGIGNMDMFVREVRATTSGPLRIVRFGSCGAVGQGHCGQIAVAAHGAVMLTRHYDAFLPAATRTSPDPSASTPASASASTPASASVSTAHVVTDKADAAATTAGSRVLCGGRYHVSQVCPADGPLSDHLAAHLAAHLGGAQHVICGLNATADTFYASQGRADPHFDDGNASLIAELRALEPAIETLEMENFMLFHLAACSAAADPASQIRAAACAMIFADRVNNAFIESAQVAILEKVGGLAVLEALCLHD